MVKRADSIDSIIYKAYHHILPHLFNDPPGSLCVERVKLHAEL